MPSSVPRSLSLRALSVPPVPIKDAASTGQMDQITTYFFALIAMACMYGGFQGLTAVAVTQANQSTLAVRNSMAPAPRLTQFAASLCAAALVQFLSILLLLLYLRFAFGVNFGDRGALILLTCLTGSLMGVGLGAGCPRHITSCRPCRRGRGRDRRRLLSSQEAR